MSALRVMMQMHRPIAASPDEPKMPVSKFTSFSRRSKANSISFPAMIQNKAIRCSQQTFATPKIDERVEHTIDDMVCGRLILDGRAFRQTYVIRSFDSSPNMKLSIKTIANYLQDTTLNHLRSIGLSAKGFGSTQEMSKQGLIWVIYRTHIVVESYPSWNDVVQVDTWFHKPGKTSSLREWILCDCKTGKTLIRASSLFALMNSKTRRLAKFTKELAKELRPYHVLNQYPIIKDVGRKLSQVDIDEADYMQTGLTPSWNDLDANQHVNNAKYMDWLIQGIPRSILESYEQYSMILEYRKECFGDAVLQSLSRDINKGNHLPADNGRIEIEHSICLDNGQEAIRGRTIWKPKHTNSVQNWS